MYQARKDDGAALIAREARGDIIPLPTGRYISRPPQIEPMK